MNLLGVALHGSTMNLHTYFNRMLLLLFFFYFVISL